MCGSKPCTKCARAAISKPKNYKTQKSFSMKKFTGTFAILKPALVGAAGFVAAKAVNKIPTVANNIYISAAAKIAAAILINKFVKNPTAREFSLGVGVAGGTDILNAILPQSVKDAIAAPMDMRNFDISRSNNYIANGQMVDGIEIQNA